MTVVKKRVTTPLKADPERPKETPMQLTGSLDFETALAYNKAAENAWSEYVTTDKVFNPRYLTDKVMPKEGNITDFLNNNVVVRLTDREVAFLTLFKMQHGFDTVEESMTVLMKLGLIHLNKEHSNG